MNFPEYNKKELKELILRVEDCLESRRGWRAMVSDKFTSRILWAYETEDSERFLAFVIPIIADLIRRENWEVVDLFQLPLEDIPLHITNIGDSIDLDRYTVFNTIMKWRLDCGK